MNPPKWVIDFGMHNGDDTHYYLTKGFFVLAVDANPALCKVASERFKEEIRDGKLKIINAAVAPQRGEIPFYVNRANSVISSLNRPAEMHGWDAVSVVATTADELLKMIPGGLEFIKIDLEGADGLVLESLARSQRKPGFISVEAHRFEILGQLFALGYRRYRLVNCAQIASKYANWPVRLLDGRQLNYQFNPHSSGPFADDSPEDWLTFEQVCYLWFGRTPMLGHGWFDVHASI